MPTLEELSEMLKTAGGDPQKLTEAAQKALEELTGAQKALHGANSEAAERRKKLEAFEKAEEERKKAELSEVEKAKAEADDARKQAAALAEQVKKDKIAHIVEITARDLEFADPDDAVKLADLSGIADDANAKAEVKKVLEALLKAKPHLKKVKGEAPDLDSQKRNNVTATTTEELLARKRAQYGSM